MQPNPEWRAAQEETIKLWLKIRDMVEEPDEVTLLTEINAICDLCDVAQEAAPQPFGRCERCIAYQQFGGCHGINGEMSERVVEHDWEGLLVLIDRFIDNLRSLELPTDGDLDNGIAS